MSMRQRWERPAPSSNDLARSVETRAAIKTDRKRIAEQRARENDERWQLRLGRFHPLLVSLVAALVAFGFGAAIALLDVVTFRWAGGNELAEWIGAGVLAALVFISALGWSIRASKAYALHKARPGVELWTPPGVRRPNG
jgi:hypothetical protein